MNPEALATIHQGAIAFLNRTPALAYEKRLCPGRHQKFQIPPREALLGNISEDEYELGIWLAMLAPEIEPPQGGPTEPLPMELFELLRTKLHGRFPNDPSRRAEWALPLVVVFGCGGWQDYDHEIGAWNPRDHPWERAFTVLVRSYVLEGVLAANRDLRSKVAGFPSFSRSKFEMEEFFPHAATVAERMVNPLRELQTKSMEIEQLPFITTDERKGRITIALAEGHASEERELRLGSRYAFDSPVAMTVTRDQSQKRKDAGTFVATCELKGVSLARKGQADKSFTTDNKGLQVLFDGGVAPTIAEFQCPCGSPDCAEHHRLRKWWASGRSLSSFVANAVKGPNVPIMVNSFTQGMYFQTFEQLGFEKR